MNTVDSIFQYSTQLLEACEAALATTLGGIPPRSYVAASQPAFDCGEQLTIHVNGLSLDNTSPLTPSTAPGLRHRDGMRHLLTLIATVIRCTPQPTGLGTKPPTEAELALLAQRTQQDAWAIWNIIWRRVREGTLFQGPCTVLYYDTGTPVPESGGVAGWAIQVRCAIDGYDPEGS